MTRSCLIIHFSISQLDLICLTSVDLPTIRAGFLPIRMTDYRYQVIFLHGSTCLLAINAKICPIGHTFQPFWVRDVEVSTHWLLRISPYGYRRRDVRVLDVHHPVIHEQRLEGGMRLLFMIGRNSCYLLLVGSWIFIRILIGQARIRSFRPIIKCPRFGLGRPLSMSRRFSVPVHVVSPAPWGCEIKQYSYHLFHVFGRRARVQAGLYAFLPPVSSFRCIFSSEDIQHPPVRWTTSQ